jgi:hypothetical protein
VRFEECSECHNQVETAEDLVLIRAIEDDKEPVDYDGDGDVEEPIHSEIMTLHEDLFDQIMTYATETLDAPIGYDGGSFPYWFADTNGDGELSADEISRDNRYASWSPNLLRAAYNYQYVVTDPGAYSHNPDYVLQILYDSIAALGGEEAVAEYNRPPVREVEED